MTPVILFGITAILSALFTAVARLIARRFNAPNAPVSTLGGTALLAALFCGFWFLPQSLPLGLVIGAVGMALIGILDDWKPFAPLHKFALTLAVAGIVAYLGPRIHLTNIIWIDGSLTALWMVWMCHAFNVLDMEDGLSSGSGTIASLGLWVINAGDWALVTAGALTGYLLHNFHPARILMGDTGSLLIGFLLSSMAISVANQIGGLMGVIGPLVALGLPIFEAVFISAVRFAKGRSIVRPSRDHVAQRLIQWGLPVRAAVALMWLTGIVLGGMALVFTLGHWISLVGVACLAIGAWKGLSRVDMEGDGCDGRPVGLFGKNWLIHRKMRQTMDEVKEIVSGKLLDVGCGNKPYASIFETRVQQYIGLEKGRERYERTDVWGDVQALPIRDQTCDTVLCNQVLEHVPQPQFAIDEMARVLRPGGYLILTAPHIWGLHEVPHDYFRFTPYGLRHLAKKSGLTVHTTRALAGFWVTAGTRFCYYLARFERGPLIPFARIGFFVIQLGALFLDRLHRVESEAWNFLLIAQKRAKDLSHE